MQCPKCQNQMPEKIYGPKIVINRCEGCGGLFIKKNMLEELKEEWSSDWLDSGEVGTGKQHNQITDIDCPGCHTPMDHIADEKQTHIHLESCPACHGLYFDAGEFTDWKYDTWDDFVKGALNRITFWKSR